MANFYDRFQDVVINGLNKAVDAEFVTQPRVNDDRTFITGDSSDPVVAAGSSFSTASFMKDQSMLLVGIGVAVVLGVVLLKR